MNDLTSFVSALESLQKKGISLDELAKVVLQEEFGITNPTVDQIRKMKLLISALMIQMRDKRDWSSMFA